FPTGEGVELERGAHVELAGGREQNDHAERNQREVGVLDRERVPDVGRDGKAGRELQAGLDVEREEVRVGRVVAPDEREEKPAAAEELHRAAQPPAEEK